MTRPPAGKPAIAEIEITIVIEAKYRFPEDRELVVAQICSELLGHESSGEQAQGRIISARRQKILYEKEIKNE